MTLTQIATAAVRLVNKENGIKLTKVAEFGTPDLGAVVYKDKEWCEFRVMYFADGEHLTKADYHTPSILKQDKEDALKVAEAYANPACNLSTTGVEPDATVTQVAGTPGAGTSDMAPQPVRKRPRGYYAQPSKLLGALFSRVTV